MSNYPTKIITCLTLCLHLLESLNTLKIIKAIPLTYGIQPGIVLVKFLTMELVMINVVSSNNGNVVLLGNLTNSTALSFACMNIELCYD